MFAVQHFFPAERLLLPEAVPQSLRAACNRLLYLRHVVRLIDGFKRGVCKFVTPSWEL